MPIFKIKDVEKITLVCIYEVEADSEQEAIDKYVKELAGRINLYYDDSEEEGISIEK